MIFTLIGTFVLGIAVAGTFIIINRTTGRRMPGWIAPFAAAIAMITFTIWSEYTWFSRTAQELPDSFTVTQTYETSNLLQPWTYLVPRINRFAAVDLGNVQTNAKAARYRQVNLHLFTRLMPPRELRQVYDCEAQRRIDLMPNEIIDPVSLPENAWEPVAGDPATAAVCGGA